MNDSYDSYLWLLAEKEVLFGVIAVNCLVLLVKLATEQCTDCPSEIPGLVASMKKHKLKVSLQLKNYVSIVLKLCITYNCAALIVLMLYQN